MFGILLVLAGTLCLEVSDSIGKYEIMKSKESLYVMGFLNCFWPVLWFLAMIVYKGHFIFSIESLPTFLPRLILEIILAHVAIKAIIKSDRSTSSFFRMATIPLLLIVDIILGYNLSNYQMVGMILLIITIVSIFINDGISKKGIGYVLFTAVVAVATLTLYKYNISRYNSVEAEQMIVLIALLVYFLFNALRIKDQPFAYLKKRTYLLQSIGSGVGTVLDSFAYLFAPASVITAAKRSGNILWTISSGYLFFREKGLHVKIAYFAVLIIGLILLAL